MKRIPAVLISFAFTINVQCQSLHYPVAIPCLSSARYSPQVSDPFTSAFNPATIPFIKGFVAGLYSEKRYMIEGLNLSALSVAWGAKNNGIAMCFQHSGIAAFNENSMGIGYGKSLGRVNIGSLFAYHSYKVAGGGHQSLISYGIALGWNIYDNVYASFRIMNPRIFFSAGKAALREAAAYHAGVGFQASTKIYAGMESVKEEQKVFQIFFSLQYQFAEKFYSRLGWSTATAQPFFNAGWRWNDLKVETGFSYHMTLGASPSVTLIFQKRNQEEQEQ